MIRIVLADNHHAIRRGMKSLLEMEQDFKIVGEASSGIEAIRLAEETCTDVLVVDLNIPVMDGVEVIREVKRHSPPTQVIVLSMYDCYAYACNALDAGALGYLVKESIGQELVDAIHAAMLGRCYLSAPLNEQGAVAYRRNKVGKREDMPIPPGD